MKRDIHDVVIRHGRNANKLELIIHTVMEFSISVQVSM